MKLDDGWAAIGERVRRIRVATGLTQAELADAIGLDDRSAVSKIERGERRIDGMELVGLGRALKVPLDHFIEDPPQVFARRSSALVAEETTEDETAMFRLQTALVAWRNDVRQLIGFGVLKVRKPLLYPGAQERQDDGREAARWLRKRLNLASEPIETLMRPAEAVGLLYAVMVLDGEKNDEGASLNAGDFSVAILNRQSDVGRRRATAAHELGHVLLGDDFSTDIGVHASKEDREAVIDAFASEFLLPAVVLKRFAVGLNRTDLIRLAAEYKVSWSLAIRQAELAEVISDRDAKDWAGQTPTYTEFMDSLGWAPQPDLEKVVVSPSVAHAVMTAYSRSLISADRAVEMMRGQIRRDQLPEVDEVDSL
ncbi:MULTISPECIES: helix-turn-helix domain-containing protein [Glycomyces]|uniref:Transcriptional regulator with XRE-family HTH domain n=2 Tax=Glycomyces TaxID=58113 RepID=A0A9X3PHA1_9ACTN|nr:XRE family transcriptional regulator [Glycomyces lechevalierae]MDA1384882.1 XRE family transcriptional regulator [Glycomyces lechevalierae]MDR7337666.1 transcriptional regulator with XRE-family HTH domain [Glycomyces lechevalierae]